MNTEPVRVPLDEQALALRAKREAPIVLGLRYLRSGIPEAVAHLQEKNRHRRAVGEAPILYQFAYWLWGVDTSSAQMDSMGKNDRFWATMYHVGMSLMTMIAIVFLPVRVAFVIVDRSLLRPLGWCLRRAWYGQDRRP